MGSVPLYTVYSKYSTSNHCCHAMNNILKKSWSWLAAVCTTYRGEGGRGGIIFHWTLNHWNLDLDKKCGVPREGGGRVVWSPHSHQSGYNQHFPLLYSHLHFLALLQLCAIFIFSLSPPSLTSETLSKYHIPWLDWWLLQLLQSTAWKRHTMCILYIQSTAVSRIF